MFSDLKFDKSSPLYNQLVLYIKNMINNGILRIDEKLPSTRELSTILNISRNTVITAYEILEGKGLIYRVKGKGAFIAKVFVNKDNKLTINYNDKITEYAICAETLDIIKHEPKWKKGMISFKSIAPDGSLFDIEELKRNFLNRISIEGDKIINYGYAKGYNNLINYLLNYMNIKGADLKDKDILITNGFTEGFNLVLSALLNKGDKIICENPTHNTAIKLMKLHGLDICGVPMDDDGINIDLFKKSLIEKKPKLCYLIPSYHNPTSITMSPEKRIEVNNILKEFKVSLVEDGFNEELRYSGDHAAPISALCADSNNVIYIGSFSKILYPGLRLGFIFADKLLISYMESIKRSLNIHTSFLDQAILYEFLREDNLDKYVKKVRKVYKEKYEFTLECAKKYIPYKKIYGEGGSHIFIELNELNARTLLDQCMNNGVIYTAGDIFYVDNGGKNTLRLAFSRLTIDEIEKGIKIIGDTANKLKGKKTCNYS